MPVFEINGVGTAVYDYEFDQLLFEDRSKKSMCDLFDNLGAETIDDSVEKAFQSRESSPLEREHIERYRSETGRQFPRVYKIHLKIELEELSDELAAKHWVLPVELP